MPIVLLRYAFEHCPHSHSVRIYFVMVLHVWKSGVLLLFLRVLLKVYSDFDRISFLFEIRPSRVPIDYSFDKLCGNQIPSDFFSIC